MGADSGFPFKNVGSPTSSLFRGWNSCVVNDQEMADQRVPELLARPAEKRVVVCELHGPVQLCDLPDVHHPKSFRVNALTGRRRLRSEVFMGTSEKRYEPRIDWVICGGELGPGARPIHPDWVRSLRDQCKADGVPFFFAGWGEWAEAIHSVDCNRPGGGDWCIWLDIDGRCGRVWGADGEQVREGYDRIGRHPPGTVAIMSRVGRQVAGRILDGVTHDAMPAGFGEKAGGAA